MASVKTGTATYTGLFTDGWYRRSRTRSEHRPIFQTHQDIFHRHGLVTRVFHAHADVAGIGPGRYPRAVCFHLLRQHHRSRVQMTVDIGLPPAQGLRVDGNVAADEAVLVEDPVSQDFVKIRQVLAGAEDIVISAYESLLAVEPGEDRKVPAVNDDIA